MVEGQISNPPESYLKVIQPLIATARGILEQGEALCPVAFVGEFASGKTVQVLIEEGDVSSKDRSAMAIRMASDMIKAEFVFVIMEAWSLRKDKVAQMEAILDKYGSISASPYRVDVVSLLLETKYGVWAAECQIRPKGISKKKRTIGDPAFRFFKDLEGRFSHLLSEREETEGMPILH